MPAPVICTLNSNHLDCLSNGKVKNEGFSIFVDPNFLRKFIYVFVTDEASGFRFGLQLGFVKTQDEIRPKRKVVVPMD